MKENREHGYPAALRSEPDGMEMEKTWRLLAGASPSPVSPRDTDRAWETLARRVGIQGDRALRTESAEEAAPAAGFSASGTRSPVRESAARVGLRILGRAAAVVLLAVGGTAAWYAVPVSRTAQAGERVAVALPDGSRVELNSGSTLRYRRGFSFLPGFSAGSRSVHLEGEAFFDVVSAVRPFRVEAGAATVRVLGTEFNVRARDGRDGEVRVEVEEGRVEVREARDGRSAVILGAGEALRVTSEGVALAPETVSPDRIAAWRSGGITAVDASLNAILQDLELRFGVRIELLDPQVGTRRLDVYYPSVESLESVLADLATQQDLRYRRTNDGWELF